MEAVGLSLSKAVSDKYAALRELLATRLPDGLLIAFSGGVDSAFLTWAAELERRVRAMQPWPTAYSFFLRPGHEPMRAIVSRAIALPGDGGEPGAVLEGLKVQTGGGVLQIDEIQPAGKKKTTAAEFLRGYPVKPGQRFGNPSEPAA